MIIDMENTNDASKVFHCHLVSGEKIITRLKTITTTDENGAEVVAYFILVDPMVMQKVMMNGQVVEILTPYDQLTDTLEIPIAPDYVMMITSLRQEVSEQYHHVMDRLRVLREEEQQRIDKEKAEKKTEPRVVEESTLPGNLEKKIDRKFKASELINIHEFKPIKH